MTEIFGAARLPRHTHIVVPTKNSVLVEPVELERRRVWFADAMFTIIFSPFSSIRQGFRTRAALHAETLALRHQPGAPPDRPISDDAGAQERVGKGAAGHTLHATASLYPIHFQRVLNFGVGHDPIPARAETNSTGSPPLVCSANGHSEILSNWYLGRPPSRDHERNYL